MKLIQIPTILSLFLLFSGAAQQMNRSMAEDLAFADTLKQNYKEAEVVALYSKELITFDLNDKDGLVEVVRKKEEQLMSVSSRTSIQMYEFYDALSEISEFGLSDKEDKGIYLKVHDAFYESADLFYTDARVKHASIVFPTKGYILNSSIEKQYTDVKYFTRIIFQDEYPILNKKVQIKVPDWLEVEFKAFNIEGHDMSLKEEYHPKEAITTYTYTINDMDGLKKETNAPGMSHLAPHILVLAKSFKSKEGQKKLFSETKDLYRWYRFLIDSMKENNQTTIKAVVDKLIQNSDTREEKLKRIYYWVQDNIRYIAFENGIAGFKPDESLNVLNKKYGDCKGMANLLKQMLISAGFDARLSWIGTKDIAYDYSLPSLAVDNHMICTVVVGDQYYFLDGTEKYGALNEYAERIQNRPVMIEDGERFILSKVPPMAAEANKETDLFKLRINGEFMEGDVLSTYSGESKKHFLNGYNSLRNSNKDKGLEYYLGSGNKDVSIHNITTTDLNNRDGRIEVSYEIEEKNKVFSFGNEIYVDLDAKKEFSDLIFEDRQTDYELPYKKDFTSRTELRIPVGYEVQNLPESIVETAENYDISINFSEEEGVLIYEKRFVFHNAVLQTQDFDDWNTTMRRVNEVYNQQIVLKPKNEISYE